MEATLQLRSPAIKTEQHDARTLLSAVWKKLEPRGKTSRIEWFEVSRQVRAAGKRRITLHFTPTYSSWLNQIEIWFNIFSRDVIRGGIWKSKQELVDQIMDYIKNYNQLWAKPFKWTYTGKPLTA